MMVKNSELVLGIISPTGTDVEQAISCLKEHLKKFEYTVEVISVSNDVIPLFCSETEKTPTDEYERISFLMDKGNTIRKNQSTDVLMKGVVAHICENRPGFDTKPEPKIKTAYIIKSIKHPDEANFLRRTYGVGFHLVGITSSYSERKKYLVTRKSISDAQAEELLERDSNESTDHGQHTDEVFQHADYFIVVEDSKNKLTNSIYRLIDLLFGSPFLTPTFDEFAMFMAYASSLRSADLSRQIGAVITKNNEIMATGANDCPKSKGGLYWPYVNESGEYVDDVDSRDYTLGYDSNKIEQTKIIEKIIENLGIKSDKETVNKIKKAGIGSLTEYGRVVHAEMEALLMSARNNISTRGATLYATTFPCHNCAKHIIAAGIERVVYIEPYPKSKALEFYKQEIKHEQIGNDDGRVLFTHFFGVGPRRFIDLFSVSSSFWDERLRKDKNGKILEWKRNEASLRTPMSVFSYIGAEESAAIDFQTILGGYNDEDCKK